MPTPIISSASSKYKSATQFAWVLHSVERLGALQCPEYDALVVLNEILKLALLQITLEALEVTDKYKAGGHKALMWI